MCVCGVRECVRAWVHACGVGVGCSCMHADVHMCLCQRRSNKW